MSEKLAQDLVSALEPFGFSLISVVPKDGQVRIHGRVNTAYGAWDKALAVLVKKYDNYSVDVSRAYTLNSTGNIAFYWRLIVQGENLEASIRSLCETLVRSKVTGAKSKSRFNLAPDEVPLVGPLLLVLPVR